MALSHYIRVRVCVFVRVCAEGVHIHRQCGGTVLSPDLFFLTDEKENCANMINGHDYLLRKCGFLAQQLCFYDLNLGQYVLSCRLSCRHTPQRVCGDDQTYCGKRVYNHLFGKIGKASHRLQRKRLSFKHQYWPQEFRTDIKFQSCFVLVGVYENKTN